MLKTESEVIKWGEWCVRTCLGFGAMPSTAFKVAGAFCQGLENNWAIGQLRKESEDQLTKNK